jgi:hypothetical protein
MSAFNSPVPTKNSFETCEHNNNNLISAFSLSLSLISLSLPALSFSPQTHTRTKRNVRWGGGGEAGDEDEPDWGTLRESSCEEAEDEEPDDRGQMTPATTTHILHFCDHEFYNITQQHEA